MKSSLQLNVSQQQSLSPQLQQMFHLLQLNTIDLEQSLRELSEQNPFLQLSDDIKFEPNTTNHPRETESSTEITEYFDSPSIQNDLPVDASWQDYYSEENDSPNNADVYLISPPENTTSLLLNSSNEVNSNEFILEDEYGNSLQHSLLQQVELSRFTPTEKIIATCIIDLLDERGFLSIDIEELLDTFQRLDLPMEAKDNLNSVLTRIQLFDPVGVASRDLAECLHIQLRQIHQTKATKLAKKLLLEYRLLMEKHDFKNIIKIEKCSTEELQNAMKILRSLNPEPASSFNQIKKNVYTADVLLKKSTNQWQITLNRSQLPTVVIDDRYLSMLDSIKKDKHSVLAQSITIEEKRFLRDKFNEAKSIIDALTLRNNTLLRVATWIIMYQIDFFEKGDFFLRPLNLNQVAVALDLSESTISRVCQNKYIYGPRGFIQLKALFSNSIHTSEDEATSTHSIKMKIKDWIENEDKNKPLSDNKLVEHLCSINLIVARRTVAKYREQLGFAPSHLRKRLQSV